MTRAKSDHYATKHPEGRMLNKKIAEAVRKRAANGEINCADASAIAENFRVGMLEVGVTVDLLEIRLKRCQLGLFGYGQKKVIVEPAAEVSKSWERPFTATWPMGVCPALLHGISPTGRVFPGWTSPPPARR